MRLRIAAVVGLAIVLMAYLSGCFQGKGSTPYDGKLAAAGVSYSYAWDGHLSGTDIPSLSIDTSDLSERNVTAIIGATQQASPLSVSVKGGEHVIRMLMPMSDDQLATVLRAASRTREPIVETVTVDFGLTAVNSDGTPADGFNNNAVRVKLKPDTPAEAARSFVKSAVMDFPSIELTVTWQQTNFVGWGNIATGPLDENRIACTIDTGVDLQERYGDQLTYAIAIIYGPEATYENSGYSTDLVVKSKTALPIEGASSCGSTVDARSA